MHVSWRSLVALALLPLAFMATARAQDANDPAVYPSADVVKTLFLLKPLPPEIQRLQTRLWTEIKSGR